MSYSKVYKSCSLFGSLRFFSNIKDSIHIINGPSGCSFFNCSAVFQRNKVKIKGYMPKIFSTDFNENDVVFGGMKQLNKAIIEIIDKYDPSVVFVYNCCVTEIIGENIDELCESLTETLGCKIVAIRSAGFKGDHKFGMKEASKVLCDVFLSDTKQYDKEKKSINIIGEFDINNENVTELIHILESEGIKINIVYPGNCTIEEIYNMGKASLSYVLCGNAAMHLAKHLEMQYGIKYIYDKQLYMGIGNCKDRLDEVFKHFNIDTNIHKDYFDRTVNKLDDYMDGFKGKSAIIVAGTSKTLGYAEMLSSLGIDVRLIFSEGTPNHIDQKDFMQYSEEVFCDSEAEYLSMKINEINPDYLITTLTDIILPEPFLIIDDFISYSGFAGMLRFAKYLKSLENDIKYKITQRLK